MRGQCVPGVLPLPPERLGTRLGLAVPLALFHLLTFFGARIMRGESLIGVANTILQTQPSIIRCRDYCPRLVRMLCARMAGMAY